MNVLLAIALLIIGAIIGCGILAFFVIIAEDRNDPKKWWEE